METLIASGRAVDLILLVIAAEAAVLIGWRMREGTLTPRRVAAVLSSLLPGVCLLLALQAAVTGASAISIAAWLAASFPLHLIDLRLRKP